MIKLLTDLWRECTICAVFFSMSLKTLSQMDYIFVPVSADRFVVESAMSFMQLFHDNFSPA